MTDDALRNPAIAALPPDALTEVLRLVHRRADTRDGSDQARARANHERNRFARALVQRDRCRAGTAMPSSLVGMIHRAEMMLGLDPGRRTRMGWVAPAVAEVERATAEPMEPGTPA